MGIGRTMVCQSHYLMHQKTFQGTKSLLFSQPLFEATSREGLENISSLVIRPGLGKLQRCLSSFARDAEGFCLTNTNFMLHNNRHLKIFFPKGVMPCNHDLFKNESNKQDHKQQSFSNNPCLVFFLLLGKYLTV